MNHSSVKPIGSALFAVLLAAFSSEALAFPVIQSPAESATGSQMLHKAWHSGVPHRRVIGDRVYGGYCPPQGCPAWTQRDLRQDPRTGEWYSPENERRRYEPEPREHRGRRHRY
ncbi:hypothetical protein [Microvirga rosea]|uniref:hypothetical protein n=1 Tax=Microvirga rosea TaxID=2715425 RepID=UPI001D0B6D3B|nr:hypothetical protein [Microvirga rosea]MCB8822697.1 hypothetical protein [Microvirga rosea]